MLGTIMLIAAVLAQTTQPVDEMESRTPVITVVAAADNEAPVQDRAPARRRRVSVATRPADDASTAAPVSLDNIEAKLAEAARVAEIGQLTGEDIEIHATADGNLIISANEEDLKVLSSLITMLDAQPPEVEQEMKVFKLESAQASEIAPKIEQLWNEFKKSPMGQVRSEDRLTIIPDTRANALMIATAKGNMEQVEGIIRQLDQLPALRDLVRFQPIQLEHIRVAEAEEMLRDMLSGLQKKRGAAQDLVNFQADVRTNTLLVSATEEDLKQIQHLVELIDVPPMAETGGVVKVALIPLVKADARDLASTLEDILAAEDDVARAMQEQIRRLRIAPAGTNEEPLPVDLEKPIKIFADPGSNSILVASVESNIEPLTQVVRLLDIPPVGENIVIKMYPLEHADAEMLLSDLEQVFAEGPQLVQEVASPGVNRVAPSIAAGLAYPIGLAVNVRTNMLIVSCRAEQWMLIQELIKALDVPEDANRFPVRMIQLQHADVRRVMDVAQQLADQRQEMASRLGQMAEEREKVLLIDDVRTNTLIVVANDDNYEEIQNLASKLDGAEDEWLGQIHIVNLDRSLAASDVADKIEQLWNRRADLRREGGLPEDRPVIVTDSRTNSMVIASNQEDYEAIKKLVDQLAQQKLSPMMDIYQVSIDHADVSQVADIVQRVFEERLRNSLGQGESEQPSERVFLMSDPVTRTLLVVSSQSNYQEILRLVDKLDKLPPMEGVLRTFYVKNIDVTKAADLIRQLFDEGIYRNGTNEEELPESMRQVTIVPDVRSSALIVSASAENYSIVESILEEIDRVETPMFQAADARFFKLDHADAVNVADLLTQLLEGMRGPLGDQADQLEFNIIPEMRSNRLIMVGTRFAMQRAEELIPQLDQQKGVSSATTKVYQLAQGSARQLEQVLTQMFEDQSQATGAESTPVSIIADETSNSLIVTASLDDHLKVDDLLKLLDRKKSSLSQQIEIMPLVHAEAEAIAETVDKLLGDQQGEIEGGFSITPEVRTNALIVWAAPDLMDSIREIVDKLDHNKPQAQMEMAVVKLTNSKAEETAELLTEFFEDAGAGGDSDSKQLLVKFMAARDPISGQPIARNLIYQDVTIIPDPNTNALLVMSPEANMSMLLELIEMLDRVEPTPVSLRVFQLMNADATDMRELMEELFQPKDTEDGTRIVMGEGGGLTAEGGGPGAAAELAFSVDERTNVLIAAGNDSDLDLVTDLVDKLDKMEIEERLPQVYRLDHQKASDVVSTLTDYFDRESQLLKEAVGDEAGLRALQREVTITEAAQGEDGRESNVLLVSCSPRMESQVFGMIAELDRPIPQVMIQVLMAEVTVSDNLELGMEFALQDLLFSEQATLHPVTGMPVGPDFDLTLGTDIGAAGASGLGGFSFTVSGEDFNFLLRALQGEGRADIQSRPSIMVQDGQQARIAIGQEVPVVSQFGVTAGGVVTPQIEYRDAKIELEVRPLINRDGYVNMEISSMIKSLAQSSVSIGGGVNAPIIQSREAETFVTVKDGETIIIGGLITMQDNVSENKVPIAGDIPILGNLFRSSVDTTSKTELLIVLTPHVVRVDKEARDLSIYLRDQTGLNENIRTSPLMQGLQTKPGENHKMENGEKPASLNPSSEDERSGSDGEEAGEREAPKGYGPAVEVIRRDQLSPKSKQRSVAIRREE